MLCWCENSLARSDKIICTMKMPKIAGVAGKTVVVGLSGGVDSSVAAAILLHNGAKVIAAFMKNWAGEAGLQLDCPWEQDQKSAMAAAEHLGIDFVSVNFEKEYKERVLDYFLAEYQAGRTPNPDILCNSEIKFAAFLDWALREEGADFIATGHYAKKVAVEFELLGNRLKGLLLADPVDENKDQTYFLSNLNQQQLERAIFPLAELSKAEVRELAAELKLPNAARPDSQGICFIGDLDVRAFLRKHLELTPGDIYDVDTNKKVGEHAGLALYTIGQREGIGVGGTQMPYYVVAKSKTDNRLLVAQGGDNPALYSEVVGLEAPHWLIAEAIDLKEGEELPLLASIRYRQQPKPGKLSKQGDDWTFTFDEPQRAVAPGQSAVFYTPGENYCLGRAVIKFSARIGL
jgi:tRNA-specific 2-thiouridylase